MRHVSALLVLGVLAIIAVFISMSAPRAGILQPGPIGFPEYAPPPRAADAVVAQHGFNALVAFTDNGFEPASLTIHAGETIRFSNNAKAPLTLRGQPTAPQTVMPREYAETIFDSRATFTLTDQRTNAGLTVTVQ